MRQRATLPKYVCFRMYEDGSATMAFMCVCGEAQAREAFVYQDEGGSSVEAKCPDCHRFIQLKASREV